MSRCPQCCLVRVVGKPSAFINPGDTVAVWVRLEQGIWDMVAGYNHNTNSEIRLRQ